MRDIEVCILAGGLSTRMGRDKSRLRLGRRTLLGHVRANATRTNLPVRVLREDIVPRCGPLGGIYSALKTTSKAAVVFLACDMPFVGAETVESLITRFDGRRAVFAATEIGAGFPLVLPRTALDTVERVMKSRDRSLRKLAEILQAELMRVPSRAVFNINTPNDLAAAGKRLASAQDQLVKGR